MLILLIGLVVGFFLGVTIMALLTVASRSESEADWAAAAILQARPAKSQLAGEMVARHGVKDLRFAKSIPSSGSPRRP